MDQFASPIGFRRRAAQCEGKVAFDDQRLARKAAKRRTGRGAYHCPCCHFWHTGTPPRKDKKPYKRNKRVVLVLETEIVCE